MSSTDTFSSSDAQGSNPDTGRSLDSLINRVNGLIARSQDKYGAPTEPEHRDLHDNVPQAAPTREPAEPVTRRTPEAIESLLDDIGGGTAVEVNAPTSGPRPEVEASPEAFTPPASPEPAASAQPTPTESEGSDSRAKRAEFQPVRPTNLKETGISSTEVEKLALKFLFQVGVASGREIANQHCLPFPIVEDVLRQLKTDKMVAYKDSAQAGDYEYAITEIGRDRGRSYMTECTYYGAAPVPLTQYIDAVAAQSIADEHATESDLRRAFSDLVIDETMLDRLGPAINSGRGLFLFGPPGNGKTSIAERVTGSFGSYVWIPRALLVGGDIVRLYDPQVHEPVEEESKTSLLDFDATDQRWVKIVRPTIIAGGELTMSQLEICQNKETKICEAPLQLKSNCGTLVIDDFGRQRMPVDELLNRWIVPLEKRYDFLNMPSGKKVQVPFDQLIVFSTNLEPKDLVDGAFLRRIPYKIEAVDPTEDQFRELFGIMAKISGFEPDESCVDYLIETHYKAVNRPFRACQPRDLLLQVRNYCIYKQIPAELTPGSLDFAVENYFSVM